MRSLLLGAACPLLLGLCAYLGGQSSARPVKLRLRLVDADTGKDVGGIVRAFVDGKDEPLELPGLLNRLRGLARADVARGWFVVPAGGAETTLPGGKLRIEALSGLETALARKEVDLRDGPPKEVVVRLPYLFRPEKEGLAAGNTHLHLRDLTLDEAGDYLRQIPAADGIKVMFISYLERKDDDKSYITNRYPAGDLPPFRAGVLFNNGEEHRHNFKGFGQGYGHVMFLDIKELVKPVSLGPGITGAGDDDRPLRPGIDEARKQGGTIVWCHNASGHEDVPSVLSGRLDALNVFDGSRTGRYEDAYYRYLNIGLRLPISTGTDWFVYDFSRAYCRVDGRLTVKGWLGALKAGRSVVTNGPLLRLSVGGRPVGDVVKLDGPKVLRVEAEAVGRHGFDRLELVHNGRVVQAERAARKGDGHAARLVREVRVAGPGWFAARVDGQGRDEFDRLLFAHTSPVYVDYEGRRAFDLDAAQALLRQVEEAKADIGANGRFSADSAKAKLLALYDQAIDDLKGRINKRGRAE